MGSCDAGEVSNTGASVLNSVFRGDALAVQRRVLVALMFRELITRYGRHNLGMLWLLLEPLLFALGVVALWSWLNPHYSATISVVAFAISGYCPVLMWRNCANRCALAIEPNSSLLYHKQVRVLDFFLARTMLEIVGVSIVFIFLLTIFAVSTLASWPADISLLIGGWVIICSFSLSLGLLVGSMTEWSLLAEKIWHPVSYFFFPISGAVYLVDWLPDSLKEYALLLPIVHGTELLRAGYFGDAIHAHYDISYAIISSLVLLNAGLISTHLVARKIYKR
jgi:capsular polysaccharide transport system permease protein